MARAISKSGHRIMFRECFMQMAVRMAWFPTVFGVALALACASTAQAQTAPLVVGLDGTFAPHAMPKLGGGVEGFNVDMANEIGKRLGRKMDIVAQEFSGLIPGMNAKKFDFLVAPTTATPERAKAMLFTEGYLNTDFQFLIKKGTPDIVKLEDLKGKVISVNKGSAYDSWGRDNADKYGFTVESYGTQSDAVQAVLVGRAYANLSGNTGVAWAAKQNPMLQLSYTISTGLVWSIPFRKDDVEMRNKIEEVVECMKLDGTFAKLSEKWLGVTPAAGSAAVTVFPGYGVPGMDGYVAEKPAPKCS
jgi:polar amino acid transport system substrate-binding protein